MADNQTPSGTFADYSGENTNAEEYPSNYEICQRSGFRVRIRDSLGRATNNLVQEWTGLWVKSEPAFKDQRNPQDFLKARPSRVEKTESNEPNDEFVGTVTADDL